MESRAGLPSGETLIVAVGVCNEGKQETLGIWVEHTGGAKVLVR